MNTWELEQAHRVGREVQRLRKSAKLTAQQLADETEKLGLKMTRQSISDLENGRRRYITTAELLVLAAALFTPPVALVFPGPYDDEVDVLPELKAMQFDAAQWFSGLSNETFGVQSEELSSARNLIDKSHLAKLDRIREATASALELLEGLEKRVADGDAEKIRLLEEERRSAGDA